MIVAPTRCQNDQVQRSGGGEQFKAERRTQRGLERDIIDAQGRLTQVGQQDITPAVGKQQPDGADMEDGGSGAGGGAEAVTGWLCACQRWGGDADVSRGAHIITEAYLKSKQNSVTSNQM